MGEISWEGYLFTQPDSAYYYAQIEYDFAEEKGEKKFMAKALGIQGVSFAFRGNFDKAIEYYNKSLKIYEEIGNQKGIASVLNNLGVIYERDVVII